MTSVCQFCCSVGDKKLRDEAVQVKMSRQSEEDCWETWTRSRPWLSSRQEQQRPWESQCHLTRWFSSDMEETLWSVSLNPSYSSDSNPFCNRYMFGFRSDDLFLGQKVSNTRYFQQWVINSSRNQTNGYNCILLFPLDHLMIISNLSCSSLIWYDLVSLLQR